MGLECAVVDRSVTPYRLTIKYEVKMRCVIPILTVLDWVMRREKQIAEIRWNLTPVLEDLEISQMTLHHCHLSSTNAREDWEIGGGSSQSSMQTRCEKRQDTMD